MKKYWSIALIAISLLFNACTDVEETTSKASSTDEIIGIYTGTSITITKLFQRTGGDIPDEVESDNNNKIVITKGTNGYTMTLDDNNTSTPPDPTILSIGDVTIASNGTSFQIPSQKFKIKDQEVIIFGSSKHKLDAQKSVAGLYTRKDKILDFEFRGVVDVVIPNYGSYNNVDFKVNFNLSR